MSQVEQNGGSEAEESSGPGALMMSIVECYSTVHGYVSVIVCVASILVNLATVVVLTRRQMVSPSNTILTGIAVTEIFKLLFYAVYAYEFSVVTSIGDEVAYPLFWIYFLIFQASLSLVLYSIVTWLTVLLAMFRYIVVCVQHGQQMVTVRVARITILCVYIFSTLVYIPSYLSLYVVPINSDASATSLSPAPGNNTTVLHESSSSSLASAGVVVALALDEANLGEGRAGASFLYSFVNSSRSAIRIQPVDQQEPPAADQGQGYTYERQMQLYSVIKIIHGPVLKLLASVLITVPTTLLIVKMQQAANKRVMLKGNRQPHASQTPSPPLPPVAPTTRTQKLRDRLNAVIGALSTLPERISYAAARRSPQSRSRSKTDCTIVVVPPSEHQRSSSNSNGETRSHSNSHSRTSEASVKSTGAGVAETSECVCANANLDVGAKRKGKGRRGSHAHEKHKSSQEQHKRTTVLLLAVVMCFVVVEFPHGVMLLIGEVSHDFFENVYTQLGDLLDLVTLLSSSLNFVLYCAMSRQFRTTFVDTFVAPVLSCTRCFSQQSSSSQAATLGVNRRKRPPTSTGADASIAIRQFSVIQQPSIQPVELECKDGAAVGSKTTPKSAAGGDYLALPSQTSEISVSVSVSASASPSVFSGTSSTSRTSQFSGVSHLSASSAASRKSTKSSSAATTATIATAVTNNSGHLV